jgi:hypothetical protein
VDRERSVGVIIWHMFVIGVILVCKVWGEVANQPITSSIEPGPVLGNYVHGLRIPSRSIGKRSIEECFPQRIRDRRRSTYPWIPIVQISEIE